MTHQLICISTGFTMLYDQSIAKSRDTKTTDKHQQESPADATVMRDSSACMKAQGNKSKLSRQPCPGTKHYLDGHFCISKMAVSRNLGFLTFESCTIRSTDPENPTLEPYIMSPCFIQLHSGYHTVFVYPFPFPVSVHLKCPCHFVVKFWLSGSFRVRLGFIKTDGIGYGTVRFVGYGTVRTVP